MIGVPADLPVAIDPCPLIDALVEVRFDPAVQPEAVFGILLAKLRDRFPKVVPLRHAI
ncbi:MAG: TIGR04255 family protein [Verrucomicrobia bacterium]|nr:TIGR04255 family protein [Verrucomicrobiota bacterium]